MADGTVIDYETAYIQAQAFLGGLRGMQHMADVLATALHARQEVAAMEQRLGALGQATSQAEQARAAAQADAARADATLRDLQGQAREAAAQLKRVQASNEAIIRKANADRDAAVAALADEMSQRRARAEADHRALCATLDAQIAERQTRLSELTAALEKIRATAHQAVGGAPAA
jgi:uncharacterized protein YPO0396